MILLWFPLAGKKKTYTYELIQLDGTPGGLHEQDFMMPCADIADIVSHEFPWWLGTTYIQGHPFFLYFDLFWTEGSQTKQNLSHKYHWLVMSHFVEALRGRWYMRFLPSPFWRVRHGPPWASLRKAVSCSAPWESPWPRPLSSRPSCAYPRRQNQRVGILRSAGGFLKWWYPNSWMVYKKIPSRNGWWLRYPYVRKPPFVFRHEDHSVNIAQPKEKLKRCDDHVGSFGIFQLLKRNTPEDSPVEFVFFYGDRGLHWQGPSLAHFEGLSHHSKTFQDIPKNTSIFCFFLGLFLMIWTVLEWSYPKNLKK